MQLDTVTSLAMVTEQRKDDTHDVERSLVVAMEHFLYERYLEGYTQAALAWCDEMGARLFEEVTEELESLAEDLGLKPFERKRLLGAPRKRDALGKPVVPAPALEPLREEPKPSTPPLPAPVREEPGSPEPEQEQSDDEPALPTTSHAAQVRVKNTFIHVEPSGPPPGLLPRGETCPAATTFLTPLIQQAILERLVTPLHELPGEGLVAWTPLDVLPPTPCEEPGPPAETVKATVDVPSARVGALIGQRGAALLALEQATGAQVSVAREARDPSVPKDRQVRVVTVQGTASAVSAARDAILAVAEEGQEAEPAEGVEAPAERTAKPAKTTCLDIWEAQVSWVVGERGAKIAAVEKASGAVISVPKQGWVRKVVIRGEEEARRKALEIIERSLPPTVTLDVPGAKVGALLGYKGETIRRIQAWSAATVSVPREGAVRTVVICGPTRQSVELAKGEVESALQAKSEARRARR